MASSLLDRDPISLKLAFFLSLMAGSAPVSLRRLKFLLESYAASAYAFATFLFFATSLTIGTNFLVSVVFSLVTRNPLIFPVFLSARMWSLTYFLFSLFHASSMYDPLFETERPVESAIIVMGSVPSASAP